MSPIQQLHDWCEKHGYDYGFDFDRQLFLIQKGSVKFMVLSRQLHDYAGEIEAMLYTLAAAERRPADV